VESLSGEFEPEKYKDTYRQQVLELIERKAEGKEVTVEAAPVKRSAVPDLMSALTASLEDAQKRTGSKNKAKQKKTPVTPSANGTARRRKPSAPTSKKVPAS
jgi:DNA end-binding protein Ku